MRHSAFYAMAALAVFSSMLSMLSPAAAIGPAMFFLLIGFDEVAHAASRAEKSA